MQDSCNTQKVMADVVTLCRGLHWYFELVFLWCSQTNTLYRGTPVTLNILVNMNFLFLLHYFELNQMIYIMSVYCQMQIFLFSHIIRIGN